MLEGAGEVAIGDLRVNRVGYGAMRLTGRGIWGPPLDPDAAAALLRRAVELGVELIDTANSYGPEVSEELIARALHPYPDGLLIATKGGLTRPGPGRWTPQGHPEHLRAACEGSLRRLRVERVDLYQLHRPDPAVPYEESVGALAELRAEGKIRHIGVSNVDREQLDRALGVTGIVSVQNRYNVADRRFQDVLEACERLNLAFLPWAPLDSGGAAGRSGAIGRIATVHGATRAQVALAWLLHVSPAVAPIPGTASVPHLESNVAAAKLELSDEEMAELASVRPSASATAITRRLRNRAGRAARRLGLRR